MKFYTTEELKIGPKRYFTPEGFLVCEDVPIGRIGEMLYGPGETPVEVGSDGIAHIDREADELFSEATLLSFNGKPVTDDHPTVDVTAQNWRDLSMGFVLNPRRGQGSLADYMIADLLLTDPVIIQEVNEEYKREVSSGYSNDYIQFEPGRGRQVKIRGNHVALVDRGRCGTACSIRDHKTVDCNSEIGDKTMAVMFKDFVARVKDAWKSKDEKSLDAALAELGNAARSKDEAGEIHVHAGKYDDKTLDEKFEAIGEKHGTHDSAIADHENRIGSLENPATQDAAFTAAVKKAVDASLKNMGLDKKTIDKLKTRDDEETEEEKERKKKEKETQDAEEETEEEKERKKKEKEKESQDAKALDAEVEKEEPKAKGAKDSAYLEESFQQTIAVAEILSPGVHIPTFDRAAKPGDTFKQVCGLRRKALQVAAKDSETALLVKAANGGRELTQPALNSMTCDSVRALFFAAGALKKEANNAGIGSGIRNAVSGGSKMPSIAEINKRNRERKWPGQN
jgi:uncharacterized protein